MNIRLIAVVLAAALADPAAALAQNYRREIGEDFGSPLAPFVTVRTGLWGSKDFEFEATTLQGTREVKGGAFVNMGGEIGAYILNDFTASASLDLGLSKDAQIGIIGANVGYLFPFESLGIFMAPVTTRLSVGGLWGDMKVTDFGDFDQGLGWRAGLDFLIDLPGGMAIDAIIDYRFIEMDFQEEVTSGDVRFGGGSLYLGVGLSLKVG